MILITTHIMSFVEELADNIVFLLEGKIYFDGSLPQLLEERGEEKLENAIADILRPKTKKKVPVIPPLPIHFDKDNPE